MSANHHDDHHSNEVKPVSFTVPFILASVVVLIIVLFLSLCDPKHGHHEAGGHGHETNATEGGYQGADMVKEHEEKAAEHAMHDSTAAPAIAPEVEGKPAEAAHH